MKRIHLAMIFLGSMLVFGCGDETMEELGEVLTEQKTDSNDPQPDPSGDPGDK
ncbi:MAG: hypothetical protein RJQ09_01075 [Cyclobacteriaceae bacterium]